MDDEIEETAQRKGGCTGPNSAGRLDPELGMSSCERATPYHLPSAAGTDSGHSEKGRPRGVPGAKSGRRKFVSGYSL